MPYLPQHYNTMGIAESSSYSNNILGSSIEALALNASESRALLASPQSFLSRRSAQEAAHIRSILIPAYQRGFRTIFLVGAVLAATGFFLACGLIPQVELSRADDDALKEDGKNRVRGQLDEEDE